MKHLNINDIKNTPAGRLEANKHLWDGQEKVKKQKYGNVIVEFDGYSFRSKKELGRYVTLRAKQTLGEIKDLQIQVPFELNEGGTHSMNYVADFVYVDMKTGKTIVEDTKGKITDLFKKKAKLMLQLFGIEVIKS